MDGEHVAIGEATVEYELSEQDKDFAKRFNLQPEDFKHKRLAELELENQ